MYMYESGNTLSANPEFKTFNRNYMLYYYDLQDVRL